MLRKKTNGVARRPRTATLLSQVAEKSVDRRAFLRTSGLAIGGLATVGLTGGTVTMPDGAGARRVGRRDELERQEHRRARLRREGEFLDLAVGKRDRHRVLA